MTEHVLGVDVVVAVAAVAVAVVVAVVAAPPVHKRVLFASLSQQPFPGSQVLAVSARRPAPVHSQSVAVVHRGRLQEGEHGVLEPPAAAASERHRLPPARLEMLGLPVADASGTLLLPFDGLGHVCWHWGQRQRQAEHWGAGAVGRPRGRVTARRLALYQLNGSGQQAFVEEQ